MTDTYSAERKRVKRTWNQWKWLLPDWDISQRYFEGAFALVNGAGSDGAIAEARADWRYLNGSVRWDLAQVCALDDAELEETVVHEMLHFLLNEMQGERDAEAAGHEERVTTLLARLFIKQRRRP